ncbi:hypothetical protein CPB86DRAFT_802203 [Serendipita vermifera]|nr:hypothetical protein CPB86DRAFT_802203 [Serendipita vermifera]
MNARYSTLVKEPERVEGWRRGERTSGRRGGGLGKRYGAQNVRKQETRECEYECKIFDACGTRRAEGQGHSENTRCEIACTNARYSTLVKEPERVEGWRRGERTSGRRGGGLGKRYGARNVRKRKIRESEHECNIFNACQGAREGGGPETRREDVGKAWWRPRQAVRCTKRSYSTLVKELERVEGQRRDERTSVRRGGGLGKRYGARNVQVGGARARRYKRMSVHVQKPVEVVGQSEMLETGAPRSTQHSPCLRASNPMGGEGGKYRGDSQVQ